MKPKTISFIILIILTFLSAGILIFIWTTIPENAEMEGLFWMTIEQILAPILTLIVIALYLVITKKARLPKVNAKWFILFPVLPNFIIGYWFIVYPFLYWSRFIGLNPQINMVTENISAKTTTAYPDATFSYYYKLDANNSALLDYNNLQLRVELAFLGNDSPKRSHPFLGSDYKAVNIKKGATTITGEIPISNFDLLCRNFAFTKKAKLIYSFSGPFFKTKILDVDPNIDKALYNAYLQLKNTPDPNLENECPEWTNEFMK